MSAQVSFSDRIALMNEKLKTGITEPFCLVSGGDGFIVLNYKESFLMSFYVVGLRESDVLAQVGAIIKACSLYTFASTQERRIQENYVTEWRSKKNVNV